MRADHDDLTRWRMPRPGGRAWTVPGTGRHRVHAVSFAAWDEQGLWLRAAVTGIRFITSS